MKFTLNIDSGNAALSGGYPGAYAEVSRMIRAAAGMIEEGATGSPLFDINGNRVGAWDLDDETEQE